MRISDWRSDVCSSDLIPVRQTGATRLVVSCRAPTIKPLSVSTRLFRHPPFVCVQELMARPKRQEDPLLPVPLPRRRPSRANTRNLATNRSKPSGADGQGAKVGRYWTEIGRAHV